MLDASRHCQLVRQVYYIIYLFIYLFNDNFATGGSLTGAIVSCHVEL